MRTKCDLDGDEICLVHTHIRFGIDRGDSFVLIVIGIVGWYTSAVGFHKWEIARMIVRMLDAYK